MTKTPDHILAALRSALDFVESEVENRGAAGSLMSDYQKEAQDAFDDLEAVRVFLLETPS